MYQTSLEELAAFSKGDEAFERRGVVTGVRLLLTILEELNQELGATNVGTGIRESAEPRGESAESRDARGRTAIY